MNIYKRSLTFVITALVALSSSVILIEPKVYAQDDSPTVEIKTPDVSVPDVKPADPLNMNALKEPVITKQKASEIVAQKSDQLQKTSQEVQTIQQKKQSVQQEIDSQKQAIEDLKQQIADKKAKAEADRQAEIAQAQRAQVRSYTYSYTVQYSYSANSYEPGQCTWHVKNLKPDLPNNLGNADQWYYNAQAMGYASGTVARPGAAATRKYGMHAVYVMEVYGDGTMLVSEMNYNYTPYATRTSIKNQADFYYIY